MRINDGSSRSGPLHSCQKIPRIGATLEAIFKPKVPHLRSFPFPSLPFPYSLPLFDSPNPQTKKPPHQNIKHPGVVNKSIANDWEWLSDWEVLINDETDDKGWTYAKDFKTVNWVVRRSHLLHHVRRRKWVRTRRRNTTIQPSAKLAIASPPRKQRKETFEGNSRFPPFFTTFFLFPSFLHTLLLRP